jgi:hypothetical protein
MRIKYVRLSAWRSPDITDTTIMTSTIVQKYTPPLALCQTILQSLAGGRNQIGIWAGSESEKSAFINWKPLTETNLGNNFLKVPSMLLLELTAAMPCSCPAPPR